MLTTQSSQSKKVILNSRKDTMVYFMVESFKKKQYSQLADKFKCNLSETIRYILDAELEKHGLL